MQADIGLDNGLVPVWFQVHTWTNDILSIGILGTHSREIWIKIQAFSVKEMHFENFVCKMSAIVSGPVC